MAYAFITNLRYQDHTRRFSIATTPAGWEVKEELDSRVIRHAQYHDWHRVERARRTMTHELDDLRLKGWRVENLNS